jgi:hypothetical protein
MVQPMGKGRACDSGAADGDSHEPSEERDSSDFFSPSALALIEALRSLISFSQSAAARDLARLGWQRLHEKEKPSHSGSIVERKAEEKKPKSKQPAIEKKGKGKAAKPKSAKPKAEAQAA